MSSTKVRFGTSPNHIDIPGPSAQGTSAGLLPMWVSEMAADGTRWVYQLTSKKVRQWSMSLGPMTPAEFRSLEDFFTGTAKGPTNTFAYRHTDGQSYATVRFTNTSLNFNRLDDNTYTTNVTLELVDQQLDQAT